MFGHDENNQNQNEDNNGSANSAPSVGSGSFLGSNLPAMGPSGSVFGSVGSPATPTDSSTGVASHTNQDDDLLNIKQQALQQLTPLVSHLDQSPEEKFRTTMMMIQASDNQSLIKEAYDTAKKISDEKARAQALLDVVNEINYFTQQHNS